MLMSLHGWAGQPTTVSEFDLEFAGIGRIAVLVAVLVEWVASVVALAVAVVVLAGVVASDSAALKTAVVVLPAQVAVVGTAGAGPLVGIAVGTAGSETAGFVAGFDIVALGPVVVGWVAYWG